MIPYFYLTVLDLGVVSLDVHTVAGVVGMGIGCWLLRAAGPSRERAVELCFYGIVAGVLAAHLGYLWLAGWQVPERAVWMPMQGMLTMPGLIAAFAVVAWRLWVWKAGEAEIVAWGEAAGVAFPWAWAVVKLGCFLVHDSPGLPSGWPWAVAYPDGARHDLALYEIVWAFCLGLYRGPAKGQIVLMSYGLLRVGLHFLRLERHAVDLAMAVTVAAFGLLCYRWAAWWGRKVRCLSNGN